MDKDKDLKLKQQKRANSLTIALIRAFDVAIQLDKEAKQDIHLHELIRRLEKLHYLSGKRYEATLGMLFDEDKPLFESNDEMDLYIRRAEATERNKDAHIARKDFIQKLRN